MAKMSRQGNSGALDKRVAKIKAIKDPQAKVKKVEELVRKSHPGKSRMAFKDASNQRQFVQTFQDVVSEGYLYDYFNRRVVDKAAANVAKARYQQLAKNAGGKVIKKKK